MIDYLKKNSTKIMEPNRVSPRPYKTSGGENYYVMKYNKDFIGDANVKDFAEGYSYTTDPSYQYKYGTINPSTNKKENTLNFPATFRGDTNPFRKAFGEKYSLDDLNNLPEVNFRPSKLKSGGKYI